MPEKEKHVLFQKKSASDYSETDFSLSGFTFFRPRRVSPIRTFYPFLIFSSLDKVFLLAVLSLLSTPLMCAIAE